MANEHNASSSRAYITPGPMSDPARRSSAGRNGQRWRRLKAEVRARYEACCRCGQRIDYRLAYPEPESFSVDHYPHPLSTHPHLAEDPANLHAAHLVCNQAAGNRGPSSGAALGQPSEDW